MGNANNNVITPGAPTNSVLLTRLATRDLGHSPSIQMPPLASNLEDTNDVNLITQWILGLPLPQIGGINLNGSSVMFNGSNGASGVTYYLVASTNAAAPLSQWTVISTNTFDSNGVFNATNPVNPGAPWNFYRLKIP